MTSLFVLHYFGVHSYVTPIRCQLVLANADWKDEFYAFDETFKDFKDKLPFGTLPVLYETTVDGETLVIPESGCIERYLAHKFGQMGANSCQAAQIEMILSLAQFMFDFSMLSVVMVNNDELQNKNKKELFEKRLPTWLTHMDKQAVRNGSNGHLVGDKYTLADTRVVCLLDTFVAMDADGTISPQAYPALFKVKERIDRHPHYAVYRKSEAFSMMSTREKNYYVSNKLPFDFDKAKLYD
ncbi:hypothetical protein DFQ26_007209 [Actinomortierella ambigua]|nr:hypothetical protein DFQ26_007209 [Actinomortierella ambigua]